MATDYKISELASATSLDGTEQLVVVKDGENRKISTNTIKDLTGFTTNDFTNAEKTKLAGIAEGAQVNEIGEAPQDGKKYVRSDGGWVEADAKIDLFIDMWTDLANGEGGFNSETGYFELNGLTDFTYESALFHYNRFQHLVAQQSTGFFMAHTAGDYIRTIPASCIALRFNTTSPSFSLIRWFGVTSYPKLEIVPEVNTSFLTASSIQEVCFGQFLLREFRQTIYVQGTSGANCFSGCQALTHLRIIFASGGSFAFNNCKSIDEASILYMIENNSSTASLLLTFHADTYARAMADDDILAALEEHPLVTLVSA